MKALIALLALTVAASAAPVTTPVLDTTTTITGQAITVPANPELRVVTVVFQPGERLPVHKHPYPHYVYVLKGTLTINNVETGKVTEMKQGSFFAEMMDTWHYGENRTKEPLELMGIDQVPAGTKSNVILKP